MTDDKQQNNGATTPGGGGEDIRARAKAVAEHLSNVAYDQNSPYHFTDGMAPVTQTTGIEEKICRGLIVIGLQYMARRPGVPFHDPSCDTSAMTEALENVLKDKLPEGVVEPAEARKNLIETARKQINLARRHGWQHYKRNAIAANSALNTLGGKSSYGFRRGGTSKAG